MEDSIWVIGSCEATRAMGWARNEMNNGGDAVHSLDKLPRRVVRGGTRAAWLLPAVLPAAAAPAFVGGAAARRPQPQIPFAQTPKQQTPKQQGSKVLFLTAAAAPVLLGGAVHGLLGGGGGVHRGHQALLDACGAGGGQRCSGRRLAQVQREKAGPRDGRRAVPDCAAEGAHEATPRCAAARPCFPPPTEGIVDDLGQGRQAVGGARGVGHDVHGLGVVLLVVHALHEVTKARAAWASGSAQTGSAQTLGTAAMELVLHCHGSSPAGRQEVINVYDHLID